MNQTVSGDYTIKADNFAVKSTQGYRNAIYVPNNPSTPIDIGSDGGTFYMA